MQDLTTWIPFEIAAELEDLTLFEFYGYLCRLFDLATDLPRIRGQKLHRSCLTPPAEAALQRMESGTQTWAHTVRQQAVISYLESTFAAHGLSRHGLPRAQDFEVSDGLSPDDLQQFAQASARRRNKGRASGQRRTLPDKKVKSHGKTKRD